MDTGILILIIAGTLALLIFLFRQNLKDKQQFTDQMNKDYRKSKEEEGDTNTEDPRR